MKTASCPKSSEFSAFLASMQYLAHVFDITLRSTQMTEKSRLVIVSDQYYPETVTTSHLLTRLAEGLTDEFEIAVICGQPTYIGRGTLAARSEVHNGVTIRRVWSTRFDKDHLLGRLINIVTISLSIFVRCLVNLRRGDRMLVLTNPPTLPILTGIAAKMRRAHPVLLVHDVYPEVLIATGILSPDGAVVRILTRIATATYRLFERIVVIGRDMRKVLAIHLGEDADRLVFIPNWGDVDEIIPLEESSNAFSKQHNPSGKVIIQYAGNIGRTHDIESILEAADALRDTKILLFQFIGGGGKAALVSKQRDNVVHLPRQPREMLNGMLSGADAVVIPFVSRMFGVSVPSRMYNIMAAGTPIVAMAHHRSELALVVAEEKCGWVLEEGDVAGLVTLLEFLATDAGRAEARRLGLAGRRAVERRFSMPVVLDQFREVLRQVGKP